MKNLNPWCAVVIALAAGVAAAGEPTFSRTWVPAPISGDSARAQGDVLDSFVGPCAASNIGYASDRHEPSRMFCFCEDDPNPSIYIVSTEPPYTAQVFPYTKLGGTNTTGGSVRLDTGDLYAADFNGDLSAIDDNIYRFDRTGATVAYWEVDDEVSGGCTGGDVASIIDVAADPANPDRVYATAAYDANLIYHLDLSDTSGGASSASACTLLGTITPTIGFTDLLGIEYDPEHRGYWLTDWGSADVLLVEDDGTFSTVRESFTASAGAYNSGVSPHIGGPWPTELWVTDFTSNQTAIVDSGLTHPFGSVVQCFTAPFSNPAGLEHDGTGLWLVDATAHVISRVNPENGAVLDGRPAPAAAETFGLAFDGVQLWGDSRSPDQLYRADPITGAVSATFTAPGGAPNGLEWDGGLLWHSDVTAPLRLLDPTTGGVVHEAPAPGRGLARGLAWDGDRLWVADSDGAPDDRIYVIEPEEGDVTFSFAVQADSPLGLMGGLDLAGDVLWVSDTDNGRYCRVVAANPPLFVNGFEEGDLRYWSSAVQ